MHVNVGDPYHYQRKVNFADTDAGGVVHFTNVLRYVEEAEHAYLLENQIEVLNDQFILPRVHVECDYLAPIFFSDVLTVRLVVTQIGNRSTTYSFQVIRETTVCAEGKMVTVQVHRNQE